MNTKTTYLSAVIALSAFALGSCSEEDFPAISTDGVSKAVAESERFNLPFDDELSTRSSLNPTASPITFAWSEGDKLAVYSSATGMTNFELSSIDQNNSAIAKFRATGFNLKDSTQYYAFFPYNGNSTDKSSIPVDYEDITQSGNGTYDHLGVKDYQVASAQAEGSSEAANIHFNFHHLGAICRFRITGLPNDIAYDRFSITASGIITKGNIDITKENVSINRTSTNTTQVIKLGTNGFVADNGTLTIYTMMAPADLSGGTGYVTLRLYTGKSDMSSVTLNVNGKSMAAGKAYGYSATYSAPTETEREWVDLGLTREDGSKILFAKTNYGANSETSQGTTSPWSETDIVSAYWGPHWRTPTNAEMWKLFNKTQDNPQLSWEYDSGKNGVWVINHSMEDTDGEGTHRIFLPFNSEKRGDYWCSTPANSFWPELQLMEAADSNVGATGPKAYDFVTEMNSGNVVNSRIKIAQTAENFIRPIYIGPTSSASK